jgi:hypothetical protein
MLVEMNQGSVRRRRRTRVVGLAVLVVTSGLGAALAGSGCASEHEVRTIPTEEAGARETGAADTAPPAEKCPTATPVASSKLEWKAPTPAKEGQCQADDVAAMRDFLSKNPTAKNEEFLAFVKNRDTTCADCIFADADLQTWPPAPVRAAKVVTFNVGACYALLTGRESGGQAMQNAWDCAFEACFDCTSALELEACRAKARTTACKAYDDSSRTECAGLPGTEVCGTPFDSIRVQCVTPSPDAGRL